MSFRIIDCEQGDPVWHQARAGAITASMFGEVMRVVGGLTEQQQKYVDAMLAGQSTEQAKQAAGYKATPRAAGIEKAIAGERVGERSETALNYAFRLAVERISGEPLDEGFESWAMNRGHELEPQARAEHAFRHDLEIERVGFAVTDDGRFGASADGFIGEDGGSEYKCLIDPARIRGIVIDNDIDEFLPQCQGGMWITGRKWWHFCLYCPALTEAEKDLIVIPVQRDDEYITRMVDELVEFDRLVEEYRERLLEATADG